MHPHGSRQVAWALFGAALAVSFFACTDEGPSQRDLGLVKLTPIAVSAAEANDPQAAWRLFDRSVQSGFTPSAGAEKTSTVSVTLDEPASLFALKVRGPAPYKLKVFEADGAELGFGTLDLSSQKSGWQSFALDDPIEVERLELRFIATGSAAPVPELELWAVKDGLGARTALSEAARRLAGDASEADGFDSFAAGTERIELSPGAASDGCASVSVSLSRPPSTFRRAYLVFTGEDLFRAFSVRRQVNGVAEQGGVWLEAGAGARTFVEEIDPEALVLGGNEVSFCLPEEASGPVTITDLTIAGELDRGTDLATRAAIGTDARDAAALLDGDPSTELELSANEALSLSFDRLTAPDVLRLEGDVHGDASAFCVSEDGTREKLAAKTASLPGGLALWLAGGEAACASLSVTLSSAATIREAFVSGSGAGERVDWPRVVVSSEREHFGEVAWVGGFVARPEAMPGAVRVAIDADRADSLSGDFGRLLERTTDPSAPWPVDIQASLADGSVREAHVLLDRDSRPERKAASDAGDSGAGSGGAAKPDPRFGGEGDSVTETTGPDDARRIRLGTQVGVDVPAGAVSNPTAITVRHLGKDVLPPLDPGLINVTAPEDHGYEFLPHGQRFQKPVKVLLPYDPALVPEGMTPADIHTYFFDPVKERWEALERSAVDVGDHTVTSLTSHFTIMINAVLTVPEHPSPLSFDPTALSSLAAASPSAGMTLIEPPAASSTGDARVAFPIELPPGRGLFSPSLQLSYSSSRKNGWLGVGWDLPISSIEIDTRFGVPTYAEGEEPRYLLDGAPIVPVTDDEGPRCESGGHDKRYRARIEGAFRHILRCGAGVSTYHFEVHGPDGTLFVYGDASEGNSGEAANASLSSYDDPHGVFKWMLREVKDANGNITRFSYSLDESLGGAHEEPFRKVYPQAIEYTSHPSGAHAPYKVEFFLDSGARPDAIADGRAGFKVVTRKLLRRVRVSFQGAVIRDLVLTYRHGEFEKSLLEKVQVYGLGGCEASQDAFETPACPREDRLGEHTLDYFEEEEAFSPPVAWEVEGDPDPDRAALGKGRSGKKSLGFSIGNDSVGGSFGVGDGKRLEIVGLYDLNGDGLADQALSEDGGLRVLYNQSGRGLTRLSEDGPETVGVPSLARETMGDWSFGLSGTATYGPIGVTGAVGISDATTRAKRIVTDLNGDGFTDVLDGDGTARLGAPCGDAMCFEESRFDALDAVDPREDALLRAYADDIEARLFLADPTVQWTAPFSGTVTLSGTAGKVRAGGDDGVTLELYHEDTLLDVLPLAPESTDPFAFPEKQSLEVAAGDTIYLRLETGEDAGLGGGETLLDLVDAELIVTYDEVCEGGACEAIRDPLAARDPTGRPIFSFSSREDFSLAGTPQPVAAPAEGLIELRGVFDKEPTAANLRACVLKFAPETADFNASCDRPGPDAENVSGTFLFAADDPVSQLLELGIEVKAGDSLLFRVESDFSFDPGAVSLRPVQPDVPLLRYALACVPEVTDDPEVEGGLECTSDPAVTADILLLSSRFGPYVPLIDPHPHPPRRPFVAKKDGDLQVFAEPLPEEPFLFAIRSDRQGLLFEADCRIQSCAALDLAPIPVTAGESVSLELLTESGTGPSSIPVSLGGSVGRSAPLITRSLALPPASESPFAGGYRGFRYALWNEKEPFSPGALLSDLHDPDALSDARRVEIAQSIVTPKPRPRGAPFTGSQPAWIGPGSAAFFSAGSLSAAFLGTTVSDLDGTPADFVDVFSGDPYARLSGTSSYFASVGVVLFKIANLSVRGTLSDTDTTTDVVDLNGDGVGDVIASKRVTLGAIGEGAASPGSFVAEELGGGFRRRKSYDYGVGFGISAKAATKPVVDSSGRPISQEAGKGPKKGGFGFSGGTGVGIGRSETVRDLVDINGDGLPDRVIRKGKEIKVALNLGDRFGVLEPFGTVDKDLRKEIDFFDGRERDAKALLGLSTEPTGLEQTTTVSWHLSRGVSIPGVGGLSKSNRGSVSRTTTELRDLNGDGLPDLLFKRHGKPIKVQFNLGASLSSGPKTWDPTGRSTEPRSSSPATCRKRRPSSASPAPTCSPAPAASRARS